MSKMMEKVIIAISKNNNKGKLKLHTYPNFAQIRLQLVLKLIQSVLGWTTR
jgi:hypothetical protein